MPEEKTRERKYSGETVAGTGFVCALAGVVAVVAATRFSEPNVNEARVVERDGRNTMTLYHKGPSRNMVEDPEGSGRYIPFKTYSDSIMAEHSEGVETLRDSLYSKLKE